MTSKETLNMVFETLMIIIAYISIIKGQETYTCNDVTGCNWICRNGGRCNGNTYICPSTTIGCTIECRSCVNTKIFSSAPNVNINCVERTGCINMEITAQTFDANIEIQCSSSWCSGITLNCPSQTAENCQCIDNNGENICNSQVNGIWGISPTNSSITTTKITTSPSSTTTIITTSPITSSSTTDSITTSNIAASSANTPTITTSKTDTITSSKISTTTSPSISDITNTASTSSIFTASRSSTSRYSDTLHPTDNFIVEVTEKSSLETDDIKIINATRIVHIYSAVEHESISSLPFDNIALIGVLILSALFCCTICIILPLFVIYFQKVTNNNSKLEGIPMSKLRVAAFSGEFDIASSIPPNSPRSPGTTNAEGDDDDNDEDEDDIMNDIEIDRYIDRYQNKNKNKNTGIAFNGNARQKTESAGYGTDTSCLYGHGGNNGYAEGDIVTRPTKGSIVMSPSVLNAMTKGMSAIDDDELDLKELDEETHENEVSITETMEVMAFAITNAALPISPLNSHKSDIELDAKEYHIDLTIPINEIDEVDEEQEDRNNVDVIKYLHIGVKTPDTHNMDAVMHELEIAMLQKLDHEEELDVMIKKTEDYNYVD